MKITQNKVIFFALGALAAIVIVKNIRGRKDEETNYSSNPKFTNPFKIT